jgi:hypothetical protein
MDRAGEALLARTRCAEKQGRDIRRGDLLDRAADLQHLRADGDDVVQGHVARGALQGLVLALEFVDVLGTVDQEREHSGSAGFWWKS